MADAAIDALGRMHDAGLGAALDKAAVSQDTIYAAYMLGIASDEIAIQLSQLTKLTESE